MFVSLKLDECLMTWVVFHWCVLRHYGEHKINIFAFFLWVWQLRHILAHTPLEFIQWIKCEHRQSILISYQDRGFFRRLLWEGDIRICVVDVFLMRWIRSQFVVLLWSQILRWAMSVFFMLRCSVKWNYLRCCGFLCDWVMRCSIIFLGVLRCSWPPHAPLLWKANVGLSWQYSWEIIVLRNRSHSRVPKLSIKHLKQHYKSSTKMYHGRDKELRLLIRLEWLANGCHLSGSFLSSQSD